MSDECLMKQETVFLLYIVYQAVMRKFTLAGQTGSSIWLWLMLLFDDIDYIQNRNYTNFRRAVYLLWLGQYIFSGISVVLASKTVKKVC